MSGVKITKRLTEFEPSELVEGFFKPAEYDERGVMVRIAHDTVCRNCTHVFMVGAIARCPYCNSCWLRSAFDH